MMRIIARVCLLLLGGCLGLNITVNAQSADVSAHKKTKEEFEQAQQSAIRKQMDVESIQRKLDNLTEQKDLWQREIVNAKSKASLAREKLTQANTSGVHDEIERWRIEASNWDARSKAAIVELERVESEIHDTVETMQTSLKKNTPGSDVILPGESVEIYVTEDESLNGVYQVRRGGYILLPRVGRIPLAGKTLLDAEKTIKQALQVNQIKEATVMVERPSTSGASGDPVIYLAGEFKSPGVWKVPRDLSPTIVTSILRAGGLTDSADLTKARLLRMVGGEALVEEVNVQAILSGTGLPSDVNLQSGDIVMVPPFANTVYVTGNVTKPGPMKLLPDDELTVYSAILRAGGFSRFADRKRVYVLREMGNGAKKKIPVSVKELQNEGGADIVLKSKDIVIVPEKFFSF